MNQDWFLVENPEYGPLTFMQDGTFYIGHTQFDLATAYRPVKVNGYNIEWDREQLQVIDPQDVKIIFRIVGKKWHADHELSKSEQEPQAPAPKKEPAQQAAPAPRHRVDFWLYRVAATLILALVFFCLIVPRISPLAKLLPMNLAESKEEEVREKKSIQNEAVRKEVKTALDEAATALAELDKAADSLSGEVKRILGIGLDELQDDSKRPRELNLVILKNAEAKQAWTTIRTAYVYRLSRDDFRTKIEKARQELSQLNEEPKDSAEMKSLVNSMKESTTKIQTGMNRVRPFESAVLAARQEAELKRAERREP